MAEVKWIKIITNIFDDEKILLIESLPEADSIIVIWFKLLCLAGKQNNSGVFMVGNSLPYTDSMLATIFRRKESTVQLALKTFQEFGMIEIINGVITIPNWEKHQNLDQMEKIKAQTRERVAKYREKQKLIASNDSCNVTGNVTVTQRNAIDIEEDKEEEKEIYKYIVGYLNEKADTNYKSSSKKTQTLIHARINEGFTVDDFKKVIDNKCADWLGNEFEKFLRPETLFGTKFESYLNAPTKKPQTSSLPFDESKYTL